MSEFLTAEENIDQLLNFFRHQGLSENIRDWRQRIEDKDATSMQRSPSTIDETSAFDDLRDALLTDTRLSESAKQLVRQLNRPINPKFTAIEAWRLQDPAKRPAILSPQEQAYVDRYDRWEKERRKWDMDNVTEERIQKWEELAEAGQDQEVYKDQADAFEEWLRQHRDLAEELLTRFSRPVHSLYGNKSPEKYHWSGLYWLAVNVLLKIYGLEDRAAAPIIRRLQEIWASSRYDADMVTTSCDEGYMATHRMLSTGGAAYLKQIDRYLLRTVKHQIQKEISNNGDGDRSQIPSKDFEEMDILTASPADSPDSEIQFKHFMRSLPEQLRS
ncbi:MAG: hypothetical protein JSR29_01535 [Nitrospira sp.]|nr:hypothetical protein [Nitrospira sp.]